MTSCDEFNLDGRYEIKRILSQRAEECFYEGWHVRVEKKVLIQKLEKKSGMAAEALSRARELGDFAELSGIFHVCDQFETEESAYVVFDFPTGTKLEEYLMTSRRIPEKKLPGMYRTLLICLQKMQEAGLRDLPVNGKNLYVQENGECILLPSITVQMPEYIDYSYQVSETMYQCLSGKVPPEKQIRLLFDEMEPIDKADTAGDREIHQIVDKGLQTDPECAYSSLDEIRTELENWQEAHKEKKQRKVYFLAGGILLFLLICGAMAGVYQKFEEKIRFFGITTETILLVPSEEMTHKDYQKAIKVLENRMRQIADGQRYLVKDDDGKVKIIMPLKLYQEAFDEEIWNLYLATPMKLSFAISDDYEGYGVLQPTSYVTFEEGDITRIEEENTDKEASASLDEEPDRKIKLTLSDSAAEKIKEVLKERKRDSTVTYVCMNVGSSNYGAELELAETGEDFHELEFLENSHFEAVYSWWEEETFDAVFDMKAEIPVKWTERTTSAFTHWVEADTIKEPSVTMEYEKPSFREASDEGDFFHNINGLADRLEMLNVPYSIGTVNGDYDRLVVKMKQSDTSEFIGRILLMDSYDLSVQDYWGNEIKDIQTIEPIKGENDSVVWKVGVECFADDMQEFAQNILDGDGYVYLIGPGKYPLGRAKLKKIPEGKKAAASERQEEYELLFDESYLGKSGKFTKNMDVVVDLLNKMQEAYGLNTSFSLKEVQFSEKKEIAAARSTVRKSWEIYDDELKKIKKAAAYEDSYAEFTETDDASNVGRKNLEIVLHMDVSQEYAEAAAERTTKLWEVCDLEHSGYHKIYYYIGERGEYPRMIVSRTRSSLVQGNPGWTITAIQYLDKYGVEFKNAMEAKIQENSESNENNENKKKELSTQAVPSDFT